MRSVIAVEKIAPTTIFTIGHSNFDIETFLVWLHLYEIKRLIDVRTKPYSRYNPQFNKYTLSEHLNSFGILYDFRGDHLGGLAENINYDENIKDISKRAALERLVLMCAEKDYRKCHRHTMLEPDLNMTGIEIVHITYEILREHSRHLQSSNVGVG